MYYSFPFVRSLQNKKYRSIEKLFLVEWEKSILEVLRSSFEVLGGFLSEDFVHRYKDIIGSIDYTTSLVRDIERISTLATNTAGVLVVRMREWDFTPEKNTEKLTLVLDGINDPGNLGTIMRIADWYGISDIIASPDTVDCYNPKVIMASMGSFTRVSVFYMELDSFLSQISGQRIYGAYLDGENIHTKDFSLKWWYLVIWSESHGIRKEIEPYITDKITIPRFGGAESLNAWVATGIILDRIISWSSSK
jgi:RNA methyltransferase, TrmH family